MLKIRCYEAKIVKSEKAGSHQELNPGHLWLEPPVLCHYSQTTTNSHNLLYLLPAVNIEDCKSWWLRDITIGLSTWGVRGFFQIFAQPCESATRAL